MATTLEQLRVVIDGEIAPFKKKMQEATNTVKKTQERVKQSTNGVQQAVKQQTGGIAAAFTGLAKIAAFAYIGKKMLDVGMYSTQMALEVTASVNQIKRQMGESSQSFLKWAQDNANALNMSTGEALKYGGVYSNLFSSFIKDSNKLSGYTAKMLQTSAVVAEGSGRTMTDVMERIRSGLLGNTEAIEDLGINVNVAMIESTESFKRFANGQSWQQLDFQTQQQIRLMAILEQATAKYGNTLSSSVNGRINLFKSLLNDAALNLGNSFLPIINAMMPALNSLAMLLKNATAKLAEFVGLLFNKKASVKDSAVGSAAKGVSDLSDALGGADDASSGVADNMDDAAKSAKKAVKELLGLAGFDEITTLNTSDDDSDSSGSGKGGKDDSGSGNFKDILPEIELTDMNSQFKSVFDGLEGKLKGLFDYLGKLGNLFKQGFDLTFKYDSIDRFLSALKGIGKSIKDIFEDGTVLQAAAKFGEKLAFALGQVTGAIGNVIMGIAVFIVESLDKSLNETKLDIKDWLIRQFDIAGEVVSSIGNIAATVSEVFYDTFTSAASTDIGSYIISAITYSGTGALELGSKLARDILSGIETTLSENQSGLTEALVGLLSAVEPIFKSIKDLLKNSFAKFNEVYDENISPFVDNAIAGLSSLISTFLEAWNTYMQPVLDNIGNALSDMIDNHIQPLVDSVAEAIGSILDYLSALWDVMEPTIEWLVTTFISVLAPVFELVAVAFIAAWNAIFDIVSGILQIFTGIIDFIIGIFTGDWEKSWNGIKDIFAGFWTILSGLTEMAWEIIKALFKDAWDFIVSIFRGIGAWFALRWNEIVSALSNVGSWFSQMFQSAWNSLTGIFQGLGSWFGQRWSDVTSVLSGIANWFSNIFRNAWNGVTSAFSNVVGFFSGIYNSIVSLFSNIGGAIGSVVSDAFRSAMNWALSTVENAVNSFIGMINGAIGMINKIPGVNLGSIGYVNLPRLARGGIVDSPTVAMIGEAGKEVVMPLENTGFLQTMGRVVGGAVVNALGGGYQGQSSGFSGEIVINIGGREFGRVAIDAINEEQARAGQLLLNL